MFDMEGSGFGAVLICDHETYVSAGVEAFLTVMKVMLQSLCYRDCGGVNLAIACFCAVLQNMSQLPLSNYSWEWQYLLQQQVPIDYTLGKSFDPTSQVKIPPFEFQFLVCLV
jgi:hypothetical protein